MHSKGTSINHCLYAIPMTRHQGGGGQATSVIMVSSRGEGVQNGQNWRHVIYGCSLIGQFLHPSCPIHIFAIGFILFQWSSVPNSIFATCGRTGELRTRGQLCKESDTIILTWRSNFHCSPLSAYNISSDQALSAYNLTCWVTTTLNFWHMFEAKTGDIGHIFLF